MTLRLRPLSPALGAEVYGVDLRWPFDPATSSAILDAWRAHHLLLFRGQVIETEHQVRFANLFGPISHRGAFMKDRDASYVSNARPDGILGDGILNFHSDHTFFHHPLRAIALYALEVPPTGGATLFANCVAALRNLPAGLLERIRPLRSLQLFDYRGDYNRRSRVEEAAPDSPRAWHSLIAVDPTTGLESLFIHHHTTAAIDGLSDAATEALIAELMPYIEDPAVGYRHTWRPGDVILWNNIALQHARTEFPKGERRTLRRTPIAVSAAEANDATAAA
ncbi:MAG: TauD/TfdA family dioxygenase [Alphaproteobacteria bacterium]|nr:TauD/TfdA family dioxygenase [Alphaproteobacteria bacterium]